MFKLIVVGTIAAFASAHVHPVNEQIVSAIRARTQKWVALSPEENPFRNYSYDKLKSILGTFSSPTKEEELGLYFS